MNPDEVNWQQPCLLNGIKRSDQLHTPPIYSFDNNIHVNLKEHTSPKGTISVYATNGKKIHSESIKGNKNSFRINDRKGLYIVKVNVEGKESYSNRVYLN
ncbi:MAG: T9SS type A sorting domain-containing protein [Flavobacteriales bacterium]|nr:T9SS type A sorting domain-containing protein [Flavobacteriales bacterium]